ncbi:DUF4232 domain-containing protein [Streptomyces pluripotens]|uniref:DUF4232 domain-containing protein n=1 Tax=Streptomyces pluripotens TaxID=1355015 RepID=A0A221P9J8_9ACTN|nr:MULTISPECIES: DUF4232 domain-containing protein [Streptomyces]ARP74167.1 hypothetical protein LK06_013850 [Streptomyces pluripotens]ASN28435.1 DUF4232 domain-containing protein [Streptomyces pluripotens]KIE25581.1 hypothetical protein LK08_18800 [Streptomyces sp. MUSC 125]MCH0557775.1 DUF4232 domain-containing protein [Streptomyces sp. MUM 16J]
MRVIPLTVTALAAALLLTACDGGGGVSGGSSACRIGGVSVQIGSASVAPAAGDTGEVPVSLTNQSTPCTLDGFPGVTLEAGGVAHEVPVLKGAKAQKLKLAKGDSASFTIGYVRGEAGDKSHLAAKSVKIKLPGSATTRSFPWSYGPVALSSTGDAPNASVSAFQRVGD